MYKVGGIQRSLSKVEDGTSSDTVSATLHFLPRDTLYDEEKPYSIQYTPHGDVPRTNVYQDIVDGVKIRNIRPIRDTLDFNNDGMIVRNFRTKMNYEDFAIPEIVREIYVPEIAELLRKEMGVENVAILEYLVRRRHPSFPLSTGKEFEYAQPVATAHIDFSPDCIREILEDRYLGRVDELMKHHYQVVNIWKPLNGPIRDWPLTLCHPHTVKADKDLQLMDRVFALNVEESIQIQHSPDQEWRFLKDQTPEEVLIFRGGDSELGMLGGVPHCSFEMENNGEGGQPRESVEVRAFISYCPYDLDMERVAPSRRHGPKAWFQNVIRGEEENGAVAKISAPPIDIAVA